MLNNTIKERLRQFVAYLNMDNCSFQRSIGVANGFLNTESAPNGTVVATILQVYPQLSPDWLLTGSGEMLRSLREHPAVTNIDQGKVKETLSEPTPSYHSVRGQDITLPLRVYEEMLNQIHRKDQQLEDAAAQIRTLFEMLNTR